MKWEYRILIADNNYELRIGLNKLGKKRWEAFGIVRIPYAYDEVYIAYLKRRKRKR